MPFRLTTQTQAAVELREIPFQSWPTEARLAAQLVLDHPGALQQFHSQLNRKDWLVAQMEQRQSAAGFLLPL